MEFYLTSLILAFKKETVTVTFGDVSYFWGQMGATAAKLKGVVDAYARTFA